MKNKVTLLKKMHYGRARMYPGCQTSRAICLITKKITLNNYAVDTLKKLGFKIEFVPVKKKA